MCRDMSGYTRMPACISVFIVLLFIFLFPSVDTIRGADGYELKGRVLRADTRETLPGASIRLLEAGSRTVADSAGWFTLDQIRKGRYTLVVSHPQLVELRRMVDIPAEAELEIELQSPPVYHETVTVTAAPWAVDRADVAQSANVLDAEEVRSRAGLSVGEAIGNLPGVRNIATGEAGGVPMIRGQTNERIRVLNNGFPHDYYQFSRRHMPNIETYDTGSIEVIRGPASVLYGTQAMGGLANLVSSPLPIAKAGSPCFHGEALLGYAGNNASKIGHVLVEGAGGNFGGRVSWTRRGADDVSTPAGDLPNTDYDQQSSLAEIGYQSPMGFQLRGQYQYWQNDLGFYIPGQPAFRLNLGNDSGTMEASMPSRWGEWKLSANLSRNTRKAYPAGRSQGAKIDLQLSTQGYRASLRHKPSGPLRGWVQLEYTRQKNESLGPVTLLPQYRNETWAAAVFEELRLIRSGNQDRLVIHFGLRGDYRHLELPANPNRGIPEDFEKKYSPVTASVGAVYRFNRTFSAGLGVSRGWRNPSEYELFAEGPHDGALLYEKGNPALKEETNRNVEFTLRFEEKKVRGFLAMYHNRFDNYIYQRLSGEVVGGLPVGVFSQSDATVKGMEGQLAVDTTPWLTVSVAGDALRTDNSATGTRLPLSPPDRAMVSAHLHRASSSDWIHPFVEIKSTLTGKGRIAGLDEPFPLNTSGYVLWELGAGVQRRIDNNILAFDLWIGNLTDRSYKDFLDTYKLYALSPGRNIRATLRFQF